MEKHGRNRPEANPKSAQAKTEEREKTSLDHGVESLVAQDNPDDSQLGAPNVDAKKV